MKTTNAWGCNRVTCQTCGEASHDSSSISPEIDLDHPNWRFTLGRARFNRRSSRTNKMWQKKHHCKLSIYIYNYIYILHIYPTCTLCQSLILWPMGPRGHHPCRVAVGNRLDLMQGVAQGLHFFLVTGSQPT